MTKECPECGTPNGVPCTTCGYKMPSHVVVLRSGGRIPAHSLKSAQHIAKEKARTGASGGIYTWDGRLVETFTGNVTI